MKAALEVHRVFTKTDMQKAGRQQHSYIACVY